MHIESNRYSMYSTNFTFPVYARTVELYYMQQCEILSSWNKQHTDSVECSLVTDDMKYFALDYYLIERD